MLTIHTNSLHLHQKISFRVFSLGGGGGGGDVDVCKECMRASVQGFIAFNEILDTFKDKKRQIQL